VTSFNQILSAVGLTHPDQLGPSLLCRRLSPTVIKSYDEIYDFLEPEELLAGTDHPKFKKIWEAADPDRFGSL
jgi:hypothetical protein